MKRPDPLKTLDEIHEILVQAVFLKKKPKTVMLSYWKDPDDEPAELKHYLVEPYSYRAHHKPVFDLNRADQFFAFDIDNKSIKGYKVENLVDVRFPVKGTKPTTFRPRWPIEIRPKGA